MKPIVVESLKYKYPGTDALALDDISFEVDEGEVIGIVGKNGSGKTSLSLALTGLIPHFFGGAYGGRVLVDGLEVRHSSVTEISERVGYVFDNPFTQMTAAKYTVYEEVAFGLENLGLNREEIIRRVDWSLKLLDLEGVKDHHPFNLSGGQMQRVAIAGIIAMRPKILVFDEPTSQLDPEGTEEVFQVIQNLANEGMTILIVSHKLEKIARFCNKIILLHQGKLVDFDRPQKVFSRDDLINYGIQPPIVTRVCRSLGIRDEKSGYYPVTVEEMRKLVKQNE
ncbi:MAG: ABC transporter ATP-binding protein [Caldibacillus sp.]